MPHDTGQTHSNLSPAGLARGPSLIDRIDPRTRIVVAVAFSLVVALLRSFPALGLAMVLAVLLAVLGRMRLPGLARRLVPVNLLMLLLLAMLPWAAEGRPLVVLGREAGGWRLEAAGRMPEARASSPQTPSSSSQPPGASPHFQYTWEGFALALAIALKANAIVAALVVLVGTMDTVVLGHALSHLRVPDKLTHLFLFTVRYLDVLGREYQRLSAAMRVRAFRPRMDRHTYRAYGYLIGMLLVRSVDRSERIVAAMKCRGFRGRFYLLDHFAFSVRDAWFGGLAAVLLAALVLVEWL